MEDTRTEIVKIIKDNKFYNSDEFYCYPDIPDSVIKKFKKHMSPGININGIAAIIDPTLFKSGKEGFVFTTTGLYYNDFFLKKIYFNYADIESISFDIYIRVQLKNGSVVDISEVSFERENLIQLLYKLKNYTLNQGIISKRESGVLKKQKMPQDVIIKCNAIIHSASVAAGGVGAGMAQLPCADSAVITPIQIGMIVGLGQVFGLNITDGAAQGLLGGFAGAFVGRGIVEVAVGWVPGAGNAINTATAAGLTEAIGWVAANQFYQQSLDTYIEGEKNGFNNASEVYEKKLRDQAAEFLQKIKICEKEKKALNDLIDEYVKYIRKLQSQNVSQNKLVAMEAELKELESLRSVS